MPKFYSQYRAGKFREDTKVFLIKLTTVNQAFIKKLSFNVTFMTGFPSYYIETQLWPQSKISS